MIANINMHIANGDDIHSLSFLRLSLYKSDDHFTKTGSGQPQTGKTFCIGDTHDDEGVFHDTADIEICGFCCYVLWTPEGLMAQLVRKTLSFWGLFLRLFLSLF
jgi:hypothetical protein